MHIKLNTAIQALALMNEVTRQAEAGGPVFEQWEDFYFNWGMRTAHERLIEFAAAMEAAYIELSPADRAVIEEEYGELETEAAVFFVMELASHGGIWVERTRDDLARAWRTVASSAKERERGGPPDLF